MLEGRARRPRPGRRRPRQRRPRRCVDPRPERAAGLFSTIAPESVGPFRDVPARRDEVEPRRRRGERHGHGGRPAPGRPAVRRRQLSVGTTIRGCISGWPAAITSTRSKFAGRRDRSTAGRIWPPEPATCCARVIMRRCRWRDLAPLSDRRFFPARSLFCEWTLRGSRAFRIWPWRWRHFPEERLCWYPGGLTFRRPGGAALPRGS